MLFVHCARVALFARVLRARAPGKLMSFLGCLARSPAESLTLLVKNKMKEIKGRSKMVHIRLAIGKAVAH